MQCYDGNNLKYVAEFLAQVIFFVFKNMKCEV